MFIGFKIELWIFRLETYCLKDSFRISWSFDLSFMLLWLNILLLSVVGVPCQIDLAFIFAAISLFILYGMLVVVL
jgi:hypothetical protein